LSVSIKAFPFVLGVDKGGARAEKERKREAEMVVGPSIVTLEFSALGGRGWAVVYKASAKK
jgi:hypothetical protein